MLESRKTALKAAMASALTQYAKTMGREFPMIPRLVSSPCSDFEATADIAAGDLVVTVSDGLVRTITQFWQTACTELDMTAPADVMVHNSLTWLMLHELHHYDLGHFELTGNRSLSEVKDANMFGVASRAPAITRCPPAQYAGRAC